MSSDDGPTTLLSACGVVHGNVITLDKPMSSLEGKRVRVAVAPIEDADLELDPATRAKLWNTWVEHGPSGPLEDEDSNSRPPDRPSRIKGLAMAPHVAVLQHHAVSP